MRYATAITILIAAFAVLSGIQYYVQSVDPSTVPEGWEDLWSGIVYIFITSRGAVIFIFIRNILGYAENWLESNPEDRSQIQYEAGLLGATWVKYEALVKGYSVAAIAFTAGTPIEPYAVYIAGALSLVTDLITKAIKDLGK